MHQNKDQAKHPASPPAKVRGSINGLLMHLRPAEVPERTLRLTLSWGLGGMATVLIVLLVATGLLLKFVFEPVPERAYESVQYLQEQVPFGQLLRNLHRWSGNTLVLITFLHAARVFYSGAIDARRRMNWLIGMALFAAVVLANFTGYLLPWDQVAYWAITISTSMLDYLPLAGTGLREWVLGGNEPGSATLLNFYVLHTAVLPAVLLGALPFHFWRIRKAGGLVVPRTPDEAVGSGLEMVPFIPHLLVREVATALLLLAALLMFSLFVDAGLAGPANPGLSPNPTKAPWYFMGLQELLLHFHPLFSAVVFPALLLLAVLLIPWLAQDDGTAGVWFRSRQGRMQTLLSVAVALFFTVAAVLLDESVRAVSGAGAPDLVGRGLLPLALIAGGGVGYGLLLNCGFRASRGETVQALFTLTVTAFIVLTLIGVWFRGAGMQLTWAG